MKKLLIYGACLLLSMGAVSCHGDDPLADNVVVPSVPAAPNSISGIVTDLDGNPVAGATVTLDDGRTTTTDANGVYVFEDVTPGNHTVTVEKDGMFSTTQDVDVESSNTTQSYVQSFTMSREKTTTIKVINGAAAEGEVTSDAIAGNEPGKIDITVDVPSDALTDASGNPVTDEIEIWVTPVYTSESAQVMDTKAPADEHDMLIGATVHCDRAGVKIVKPINVTFDLDESCKDVVYTQVLAASDRWNDIASTYENGNIVIKATEFTTYGVFIDMTVDTAAGRDNLTFNPAEWNNINGSGNLWAENSSYNYKAGAEITSKAANALEGLLIEHLARKVGNTVKTLPGVYPIKQSISVGAALRIWGYQQKLNWTLTGKLSRRTVRAVSYGTVSIFTEGWVREHNGGGSAIG